MMNILGDEVRHKQLFLDQLCAAWSSEYRQRGGAVYCGKGCSGCCSLVVNCTFPEAALVAAALTEDQLIRLRCRVQQMQIVAERSGSLKEWLAAYREQIGSCPFLDEAGACSMYLLRPLSCRSLVSTKEAFWCSTDFSNLTGEEKLIFMESLDSSTVAFPTHYAATPQEIGRELEEACLHQMETVYGFSIVGSLLWLVWLESEYALGSKLSDGSEAIRQYLNSRKLLNNFLVVIN